MKYTVKSKKKTVGKNYKVTYQVKYSYLGDPKIKVESSDRIWYGDWICNFTYPNAVYTVFDYQTGMSLEAKNKLGVKVKDGKTKFVYYPKQYYEYTGDEYDSEDSWLRNTKTITYSFTVTYPKKCRDVVVGIGLVNRADVIPPKDAYSKKLPDNRYWTGKKTPYGKTSYYKKGKKTMSYMRLK